MADKDSDTTVDVKDVTTPGEGTPTPKDAPKDTLNMTQAQLTERLQRKEAATTAAFLKDLGVEDVDALKGSLKALRDLQAEKLTAEEKVQLELKTAQEQAVQFRAEADAAKVIALESSLTASAFTVMATLEQPFADPSAALRLTDMSGVIVDGVVSAEKLSEAIKATATKYPWALAETTRVTPSPSKANPQEQDANVRTDEQRRAIYFGHPGESGSDFFGGGGLVTPE